VGIIVRQVGIVIAFAGLLGALAAAAKAEDTAGLLWEGWHGAPAPSLIRYRVVQNKVVELAHLTESCGPGASTIIQGKVVKPSYANNGVTVNGFVLESADGRRSFINVYFDDGIDLADLGWITQGLQTLLRAGNSIQGSIQVCGASGRILNLDTIRLVRMSPARPNGSDQTNSSPPTSTGHAEIALLNEHGTMKVPVVINGSLTLNFTVDSGAADVSIPADVVMVLMRTGTLTISDFLGTQNYRLADGSVVPSKVFRIRTLMVGDRVIENVTGSMAGVEGSLLLGQSFLSRFTSWSIDNKRQVLVLQ
jgi:aspartyl protease family protein